MTRARAPRWLPVAFAAVLCGASNVPAAGAREGQALGLPSAPDASKVGNEIRLLDPGRPPTSPLRMELTEGTVVRATIETRRSSQTTIDGIPGTQQAMPPVRVTASTTVDVTSGKGDASLITTYDNVVVVDDGTLDADARAKLEVVLSPLEDVVLTATVSSRNETKASKITGMASLDSAAAQLLERHPEQLGVLPVPFPREPVGAGARWQRRAKAVVAGVTVDQTYEYSLREVAGSRVVVDVEYVQTAPRQRATAYPGFETASRIDVTRYRVAGQATVTIDLAEPMPVQSSARLSSVQVLRVRDGQASSTRAEKQLVDVLVTRVADGG